jgi:uncharacterized protein (TIGR00269 family)
MQRCDRCSGDAVYLRRYSGQRMCEEHFLKYFEGKVVKTMKKEGMLRDGEKVGVGVSGGKDSLTTLHMLKNLEKDLDLRVYAIAVDEGVEGYRAGTLRAAEAFCRKRGIPLYVVSFKEDLGFTLDEVVKKRNPCTYCGVFRRKLLNAAAVELGLDKLATGHNLDDEVQAIMMNYLSGDVERIARYGSGEGKDGLVQRIKPLAVMPEKEVALYAFLKGLGASFAECPYAGGAMRSKVRDWINALERDHPGIKFSILAGSRKMQPFLKSSLSKELRKCEKCGAPTSGPVCKACLLLEEINLKGNETLI